ncbi:hypothetical protein Taro_024437 [Colocasia esculenta]|uniref:H15 domain-containing protein n=1 Tax=Colocasia esculenta TaxID=4460 RepID=A0A843V9C4_COLES|nr:hypothetical protein [Colocasia esculenta]
MASPTAPPPSPVGVLHTPGRKGTLPVFAGSDRAATCGRRFKNGVSHPPPGPRRTPDHPPYAEMIQVALEGLAENGGSTVDAISRRIATIYVDLPWAHKRLLPHYLGRLIAAGEVAVAAPGRYALLSPSPAPAGGSNPDPNLNPSSQAAPCTVNPHGPPVSADSAECCSSSSFANAAALDNWEGEGLGARILALTAAGDSFGGNGDSHCDRSSMPAAAATHGGDEVSLLVPVPTSPTAFVVGQNERPLEENRPSGSVYDPYTFLLESKGWGNRGGNRPRLRRRGGERPPNGSRDHWQPASGIHISGAGLGGFLLSEYGKDRPPKFKTLSRDVEERLPMSSPSVPPKCKPTVVTSHAIPANDNVHLLRFSSSGDPNHMEPSGDVCLYRSLGYVSSPAGDQVVSSNCGGAAPKLKVILRLP